MSAWMVLVSVPIASSWVPPPLLNQAFVCWATLGAVGAADAVGGRG